MIEKNLLFQKVLNSLKYLFFRILLKDITKKLYLLFLPELVNIQLEVVC